MIATADQHGDRLAVYGIEYALERLRAPATALADRETPVDLVTAEKPAEQAASLGSRRAGPARRPAGPERRLRPRHVALPHLDDGLALANQAPDTLLVATGMTLVIITGGIDLSAGSVLALSGAVFGLLLTSTGMPIAAAAFGALMTGAACGLVNGSVTVRWRLPSFLVTLAGTLFLAAVMIAIRYRIETLLDEAPAAASAPILAKPEPAR